MANLMLVSYLKTVLRCRHQFSHNELISAGHFWAKKNMPYSRVIKIFFVSKSFKTYGGLTPLTSGISIPSFVVLRCPPASQRCLKVLKIQQRGRSEEHTSELQSHVRISYAVFCLKKKKPQQNIIKACLYQIRRSDNRRRT